jgi:uncharacterized protein (TIGR02246 family)
MGSSAEHHVARIRALDAQWLEAAARRDLDGMMATYAPEAQELLPDTPPLVGRAAISAFFGRLLAEPPRFSHDFEARSVLVAGACDLAVVQGSYRFTPDTRQAVVHRGKFVGV